MPSAASVSLSSQRLSFLGHIVSADGLEVDPAKVAAVQRWPQPSDIGQVRAFLGLGDYFRKFIQGYSNLVRPLNDLLHRDAKSAWDERCTAAFMGVKRALMHAPVLPLPDFAADAPGFDDWCDASGYGTGATLMQRGKVIAYEARSRPSVTTRLVSGNSWLLCTPCGHGVAI